MKIPYGRQDIQQEDLDAVIKVLKSDFLTQGPMVPKFENEISKYCTSKYGVAVNSATSALHISLLALGVGEGDNVWTTPNTFVATANAVLYCGAQVDFVDINPLSYNIDNHSLEQKLKIAKKKNQLPKVIIPVHLTGQSCDMQSIHLLSKKYGFRIIEDASHSVGSRYKNKPVGSCQFSDITVFSFHPVKIITTGEGGIALTNNKNLYQRLQILRSHGVTRDPNLMTHEPDGPWYYQQIELGFNYRMTDFQAALGLSQVLRLNDYINKRNLIANYYSKELSNLKIKLPANPSYCYSSYHLYVVRITSESKNTRQTIFEEMRKRGIGVNLHYIPVHTQPFYLKLGFKTGDYPEAEAYYKEAISLPIYPTLSLDEQNFIISTIKELVI